MSDKITQEQLQELQESVNKLSQAKVVYADASIQLLAYQNQVLELDKAVGEILQKLGEEYGDDKRIDISTGALLDAEKEE